eukprot:TRINITY_DN6517_c0_g2_i1.p1 TRINITY_DN6517_c0_g2~~TRINITY_DN6517_c0_g2_i1.p1  ORF type:complete len:686 (+),score=88.94 TRINITY_DN6517_c0_g2_i1:67-2058(+)
MSCEVFEALISLGEELEESGEYISCLRCLEAACSLHTLPVVEAKLRIRIVQLLLAHTDHVVQAIQHIKKAQLSLSKQPWEVELKLMALDLLGQCYKLEGELKLSHHTYQQALQELQKTQVKIPQQEFFCYFQLKLIEATCALGQLGTALEETNKGEVFSQQNNLFFNYVIFFIVKIQLRLRIGQDCNQLIVDAENYLLQIQQKQLQNNNQGSENNSEGNFFLDEYNRNQIEIILGIFKLINHLKHDSYLELTQSDAPVSSKNVKIQLIIKLENQISEFAQQQKQQYEQQSQLHQINWLEINQLRCLFYTLCTSIFLPLCIQQATDYHILALQESEKMLEEKQIQKNSNQQNISSVKLWNFTYPLTLRLNALIQQFQISICTTNYMHACEALFSIIDIQQRFPLILNQFIPQIHVLIGMYFHAIEEYEDGSRHFRRAGQYLNIQNTPKITLKQQQMQQQQEYQQGNASNYWNNLQLMWRVGLCVCELSKNDVSSSFSVLAEILGECMGAIGSIPNLSEKSLGLIGSALAFLVQGNHPEARTRLGRALKTLNSKLQNGHVMVQVLGMFAPLFIADGDTDGAKYLINTSNMLQTKLKDVAVQYIGRSAQIQYITAVNREDQVERIQASMDAKEKLLLAVIRDAKSALQENQIIRDWDLQHSEDAKL